MTFDGHRTEVLAAGVGVALQPNKTDKGIGFRSNRAEVLTAYGTPTAVTMPQEGQTNLIYDEIGVAFRVFNGGRKGGHHLRIPTRDREKVLAMCRGVLAQCLRSLLADPVPPKDSLN
jgi:hypothetical protein